MAYRNFSAWDVRSAGTEKSARIKVTSGILNWADIVIVMEKRHKERLEQKFPGALNGKACVCLFIADDYEFMDPHFIELLHSRMREHFPEIEL